MVSETPPLPTLTTPFSNILKTLKLFIVAQNYTNKIGKLDSFLIDLSM